MSFCENCQFNTRQKIPYEIRNTGYIIVSSSPDFSDLVTKKPLSGETGRILNAIFYETGLSKELFTLAHIPCCPIDKNKDTSQVISSCISNCKNYLSILLSKTKPKLVITLGDVATKIVSGLQKITENRGKFFKVKLSENTKSLGKVVEGENYDFKLFVTLHPVSLIKQVRADWLSIPYSDRTPTERILFDDFREVSYFIRNGSEYKIDTKEYVFIKDDDLKDMLNSKVVAIDLETTGVKIYNKSTDIICLSITDTKGKAKILRYKDFGENIKSILENENIIKVVANRPFDEAFLEQKANIKVKGLVFDVFTMAHLLDENYKISLENISNAYTNLKNIKNLAGGMRSSLQEASDKLLVEYAGVDADATLQSFSVILKKLSKNKHLLKYYLLFIMNIQDMLSDINKNGVLIDLDRLRYNENKLLETSMMLEKDAINLIPADIKLIHLDKGLKLSRNELVADYLFKHKSGLKLQSKYFTDKTKEPAITTAHLSLFKNEIFIDLYLRWKKAQKIYTTYFPQLLENICDDNRIYPSILLYKTVTGRTVMLNPAMQTFPKRGEFAKYILECIIPDKGWVLGERDLSQSELRIMGWLSKDNSILTALSNKIDLHSKTASVINNIPLENVTKEMRDKAKAINFGFIYGMSAKSFQQYAKDEYGLDFTEKECVEIRNKFFNEYKGLPKYYEKILNFCRKTGKVVGVLGRERHLPKINSKDQYERGEAERQAINFQIQNFSSDLGLLGMYLFWEEIQKNKLSDSIKPLWFIHDAILFQAKKEVFDYAMNLLKNCLEVKTKEFILENFGIIVDYPIESDGKFSETNLNEMKKYV